MIFRWVSGCFRLFPGGFQVILRWFPGNFQVVSWAEAAAWAGVPPAAVQRAGGGVGFACRTTLELLFLEKWGALTTRAFEGKCHIWALKIIFYVAVLQASFWLEDQCLVSSHFNRGSKTPQLQVCVWGLEDLSLLFSKGKAIANKFRTTTHPEVLMPMVWW